jgi:hypothetical protein
MYLIQAFYAIYHQTFQESQHNKFIIDYCLKYSQKHLF